MSAFTRYVGIDYSGAQTPTASLKGLLLGRARCASGRSAAAVIPWADLGAILWSAGLRVTAAWNIVTETESALKEGNYVQGTVCLVLRKRLTEANARRMEIEAEIEAAVAQQLARLTALDEAWTAETLYSRAAL
jgi:adenine-specific DNA methylase